MTSEHSFSAIRFYVFAIILTIIILLLSVLFGGSTALLPVLTLALIEVTFSFENAVVNSRILATMSNLWQTIFLTLGIAVAVFGVRLFLPIALVSATTHRTLSDIADLALKRPEHYAELLKVSYPLIAAFGGVFLLMIALEFFAEEKEVLWLRPIERRIAGRYAPWLISVLGGLAAILIVFSVFAKGNRQVLIAAAMGGLVFVGVRVLGALLQSNGRSAGKKHSGLAQFMYLELLDASFSFDGVVAAFAITKEVVLIAAGLGIGALYVRSFTVHLLRRGTLARYRYLIHGAHYAILLLAIVLILSITHEIPDVVTGLGGLVIIGLAYQASRRHNRRYPARTLL